MPASEARLDKRRELEARLILDSSFKSWTLAENFIAEKDVRRGPYEFGYAVGIYRRLGSATSPGHCNFCLGNIEAGAEMYGVAFKVSPNFGLTDTSAPVPAAIWCVCRVRRLWRCGQEAVPVRLARRQWQPARRLSPEPDREEGIHFLHLAVALCIGRNRPGYAPVGW